MSCQVADAVDGKRMKKIFKGNPERNMFVL
jgi:hypothetical protein